MNDLLGKLYFELRDKALKYRKQLAGQDELMSELSERDFLILEFIYSKGEAIFSEIVDYLETSYASGKSVSSISQTITKLFTRFQLIDKKPNLKDQRQPIISLTEKGCEIVQKNHVIQQELIAEVIKAMNLSDQDRNIFIKGYGNGIKYLDQYLAHNR